jgi:hypothetical protein
MKWVDIIRKLEKHLRLLMRARPMLGVLFLPAAIAAPCLAAEKAAVFPAAPYDRYLIYESLALFWVVIIGLIVIIRMKLKEIERTQALGADREDPDAPLLR